MEALQLALSPAKEALLLLGLVLLLFALAAQQALELFALLLELLATPLVVVLTRALERFAQLVELAARGRVALDAVRELLHRLRGALRVVVAERFGRDGGEGRTVEPPTHLVQRFFHRAGVGRPTLGELVLELANASQGLGAIEATVGHVLEHLVQRAGDLLHVLR